MLKVDSTAALTNDLERLETIIDVVEAREMPPEPEPELDGKEREAVVAELRRVLRGALARNTDLPSTPIRRMSRGTRPIGISPLRRSQNGYGTFT